MEHVSESLQGIPHKNKQAQNLRSQLQNLEENFPPDEEENQGIHNGSCSREHFLDEIPQENPKYSLNRSSTEMPKDSSWSNPFKMKGEVSSHPSYVFEFGNSPNNNQKKWQQNLILNRPQKNVKNFLSNSIKHHLEHELPLKYPCLPPKLHTHSSLQNQDKPLTSQQNQELKNSIPQEMAKYEENLVPLKQFSKIRKCQTESTEHKKDESKLSEEGEEVETEELEIKRPDFLCLKNHDRNKYLEEYKVQEPKLSLNDTPRFVFSQKQPNFNVQEDKIQNLEHSSFRDDKCNICFENYTDGVLMECGHGGLCFICALKIYFQSAECPMCRQKISQILQIDVQKSETNYLQIIETVDKTNLFHYLPCLRGERRKPNNLHALFTTKNVHTIE